MKLLPSLINLCAALLLILLGAIGYLDPAWFFTEKYDVIMTSPQSKTELRVMMGMTITFGVLWLILFFWLKSHQLLLLTGVLTFGFIIARLGGLYLDGLAQHFTYIELAFEIMAFAIVIIVYQLTGQEE